MTGENNGKLEIARNPIVLIHGDRDASFSSEVTSKPAAALIPAARLVVYEGALHGLCFTHKETKPGSRALCGGGFRSGEIDEALAPF